jgi:ubiquinone/menaquinone biosynthesis C-methylase UbiE
MLSATALPKKQPVDYLMQFADYITASKNKTLRHWIIEQLRLQPYQHILEIGFGTGNTLHEVAKKLQPGFLAGTEESLHYYQQALRRNKKFIQQESMQLHLGAIENLPYPNHYFHSIYVGNIYASWVEPKYKFMQLAQLLKSNGKLLTVFQQRSSVTEKQLWQTAEKIQHEYEDAGLTDIRISFSDMGHADAIAVVGSKE